MCAGRVDCTVLRLLRSLLDLLDNNSKAMTEVSCVCMCGRVCMWVYVGESDTSLASLFLSLIGLTMLLLLLLLLRDQPRVQAETAEAQQKQQQDSGGVTVQGGDGGTSTRLLGWASSAVGGVAKQVGSCVCACVCCGAGAV